MTGSISIKRIEALSKFTEEELLAAIKCRKNKAKNAKVDEYKKRIVWLNHVEQACKDRFGVSLQGLMSTRSAWGPHIAV